METEQTKAQARCHDGSSKICKKSEPMALYLGPRVQRLVLRSRTSFRSLCAAEVDVQCLSQSEVKR